MQCRCNRERNCDDKRSDEQRVSARLRASFRRTRKFCLRIAEVRSGVLFHLYEVTKEQAALEASLSQYKKARAAWAALAEAAKGVYMSDITLGEWPQLRGHWLDRLPAG